MENDDTILREALLSGLEPSDELRDRFERQVAELMRRPLTTAEKCGNVVCSVVFIPMSAVFAYFACVAGTVADPGLPLFVRLLMCAGFSLASLVFLVGAWYSIHQLVRGRIARRQAQQMMVALPVGVILLESCASLVYWDALELSVAGAVKASFALLFYWIMGVGFVLFAAIRWQREDVLLEQKRTQLEIALLREAMSK